MGYTEKDINRIIELFREIESRKEHPNAAMTYKDVPALKEIENIITKKLAAETPYDRDTLVDSIAAVRYLGSAYEYMWRIAYAVKHYDHLMKLHLDLFRRFGERDENCNDDYYSSLRARNYYGKDLCDDLKEIAKELLPENDRTKIETQIFSEFHPLKHDPVELTDKYLSVIDEIERRMDTDEIKKMHSFTKSRLFGQLLLEYGIEWKSVTSLNPGCHFD